MPLIDTALRNLKSDGTPTKLADSEGLCLYLSVSGGKLWRMDYRYAGKRKTLSFGAYPAVSLKDARRKRDKAKEQLADDIQNWPTLRACASTSPFPAENYGGWITAMPEKERRSALARIPPSP